MAMWQRMLRAGCLSALLWPTAGTAQTVAQRVDPSRFSLPIPRSGPPATLVAAVDRGKWKPVPDLFATDRGEDPGQFASLRALPRQRTRRPGLDATVELKLVGGPRGVDTRVGMGGLPGIVQRALER